MNISELKDICSATCFRFINNELVYPSKKTNMSFMFVYPTDGFYLTKEQYKAIFKVIKKYQGNSYYISDIEFEESFITEGNPNGLGYMHEVFTDFVYDDYIAQERLFENALYDIDGKWGISIFQDFFAIIFGEDEIIKEIRSHYSNSNDLIQLHRFIESTEVTNKKFKNSMLKLLSHSL